MAEKVVEGVDLLVIGGGKAGKSLAMDRAKAGWTVVMVERDKIGGACINVACIPTKALVGSARSLLAARHAAGLGVEIDGEPTIDLERLRAHREGVVDGMVAAHTTMFPASGMDFVLGTARFAAARTVQITTRDGGTRLVRGRDVVINTGTTPAVPDLPGVAESGVWNSETILRLERLPDSLLILGGTSGWSSPRCSPSSAAVSPCCRAATSCCRARLSVTPRGVRGSVAWARRHRSVKNRAVSRDP